MHGRRKPRGREPSLPKNDHKYFKFGTNPSNQLLKVECIQGRREMPNANYYREQAQILMKWAVSVTRPDLAERLTNRAQEMLRLAEQADSRADAQGGVFDIFNAAQMKSTARERAQHK